MGMLESIIENFSTDLYEKLLRAWDPFVAFLGKGDSNAGDDLHLRCAKVSYLME